MSEDFVRDPELQVTASRDPCVFLASLGSGISSLLGVNQRAAPTSGVRAELKRETRPP